MDISSPTVDEADDVVDMNAILLSGTHRAKPRTRNLFLTVFVAYLAPLLMGYTIGYSSPALPMLTKEFHLTDAQQSWFGSLMPVGAIFGGPCAGFLLDRIGRKGTVMASALPFSIGFLLIAVMQEVWGLYLGRILTGVGAGMASLSTPVYISELAHPEVRGFLGTGFQVSVTLGILLVYILGIPLSNAWLSIFAVGTCVILILVMLPSPETPRYWLIKHCRSKALRVLEYLRGPDVDVDFECREVENSLDNSNESLSMSEFFQRPIILPLGISLALMFFQQFSGINAVMFYTVDIFKTAAPGFDPNYATIIVGLVQFVTTIVAAVLMDRAGRKVLLIVAGLTMAVSSTTFGLYYQLTQDAGNNSIPIDLMEAAVSEAPSDLSWLSLVSMVVYIIGFSLGLGPIPWLIMSEIFPSKGRGIGTGIATAFNWFFGFIITKEFLDVEKAITQQGTFWSYAGICLIGVLFVLAFVPETKGKSLEEIERNFRKRSN